MATIEDNGRDPTTTGEDELDILTQNDLDKIMRWNQDLPRETNACFHDLFQQIVQNGPDSPAICSWGDGDYTYRELDTVSTRLADHLNHDLGIAKPETPILICFDKSSIAMISMLSIFKAGGAFVAVDSAYPRDRLQAIIQAANASVVLVQPTYRHIFKGIVPEKGIHTLDLAYLSDLQLSSTKSRKTRNTISPLNTAYIHFTSGSTGTPKGIMIEHRQLCTAVSALASPMRISSTSRVLQFAAYTFDLAFGDIFVTLSQGGCVCVPSEHERINDLAGAINRMNVNNACLVPSVARILHPKDVTGLQTLLLGGEALLQENLECWAGKVALSAMYGPSECTIWCTSQSGLTAQTQANNIGRGYGARLWITKSDDHNRLVPIGSVGELLIEGPVLARGYLNAEQTKDAFVENVAWAKGSSASERRRFYKTGDLVTHNSDGTVNFVGRKDTQIKLHGRRIEIGDIEHHLASHPLVRQSMVMVPSAGVHAKQLVGVVVLADSISPHHTNRGGTMGVSISLSTEPHGSHLSNIKEFLSQKLPAHMIPRAWVVVQGIPLLISDKMNRVAVKKFVESLTVAAATPDKTRAEDNESETRLMSRHVDDTEMEKRLRSIWAHALSLTFGDEKDRKNQVDVAIAADQDFSSLGGDSFSAMELVARCKAEGLTVTVNDVLGNNGITIREMVKMVQRSGLKSTTKVSTMPRLRIRPLWWHP
jgi:amino acid adenylation domain-containing protein